MPVLPRLLHRTVAVAVVAVVAQTEAAVERTVAAAVAAAELVEEEALVRLRIPVPVPDLLPVPIVELAEEAFLIQFLVAVEVLLAVVLVIE